MWKFCWRYFTWMVTPQDFVHRSFKSLHSDRYCYLNLTISESIKKVNLLNQLQANCGCHSSPLRQYGCTTTFSQEKYGFSVNNTAGCLEDWKIQVYVFPTGVQLMMFWSLAQMLYYCYATGDWWEQRVLSQVHVQFPSNRSTISMRYSVLTTCIEQSMLRSPIRVQYNFFIQD